MVTLNPFKAAGNAIKKAHRKHRENLGKDIEEHLGPLLREYVVPGAIRWARRAGEVYVAEEVGRLVKSFAEGARQRQEEKAERSLEPVAAGRREQE